MSSCEFLGVEQSFSHWNINSDSDSDSPIQSLVLTWSSTGWFKCTATPMIQSAKPATLSIGKSKSATSDVHYAMVTFETSQDPSVNVNDSGVTLTDGSVNISFFNHNEYLTGGNN